ncbi:hypothetical protein V8G54_032006 [Vigna mungo]|uniref:Uncharacterized protein n=1 Tax=Vigna mungo TaxID=3915 RepID=A0AAQ3MLF4_VIGMU
MSNASSLLLMEQIQHLKSSKIIKLPIPEPSIKEKEKKVKSSSIERQNPKEKSNSNDGLVIKDLKKHAAFSNKRKELESQTATLEPKSKRQKLVIKRSIRPMLSAHASNLEARRAAEKAYDVAKVDERVNRAVAAANRAANAARVASVKAVQNQMHHNVNSKSIPISIL